MVEFNKIIKNLHKYKAPGPDTIPNTALTEANAQTKELYLNVFNHSKNTSNTQTMAQRRSHQTIQRQRHQRKMLQRERYYPLKQHGQNIRETPQQQNSNNHQNY